MSAYGLRASLMVGFGVMAMALGVGMALGLCAGYFGGAADAMLTRTIAAFQVVPRLFLAIFVGALFGPSLSAIALVLGLTSWPLVARLVRAETMALRSRGFVLASHALGCSHGRVILRHILPNAVFQAAATTSTLVGSAVLAEAALGFIGLSDGRTVSLGRLIAEAYPFFALAPWMSFVPVSMLVLLVLSAQAVVGSVMSGAGSDWRISATST